VRQGHPVLKRGLTLERFTGLGHVLITITGEGGGVVDTALAAKGLSRRVALRIPSFLAAPLVVARSDLVVTLPRHTALEFAALAPLAVVVPPLKLPGFDISQLWHERHQADQRHAWLRKLVHAITSPAGKSVQVPAAELEPSSKRSTPVSTQDATFVSGRTRVFGILGHPIEQVRSPEMISAEFMRRGAEALLIPVHVLPADFDASVAQLKRVQNFDGFVFTIPYKASAIPHADALGPQARSSVRSMRSCGAATNGSVTSSTVSVASRASGGAACRWRASG
jgi:hypothetical protein